MGVRGSGLERENRIRDLCDGVRTSHEIAALIPGENAKYVQATMLKYNMPRLRQAPPSGERNPAFVCGRTIDLDCYVLVSAPLGHPHARMMKNKIFGRMLEHRLVMEQKIGRYLDPSEIVDHIDGIHLHNCPSNLRLFDSNADHLRCTITGKVPQWSQEGYQRLRIAPHLREGLTPVNTYRKMRANGDVRLRQILLAWLSLDKASTFLLGTIRHLEKAGIFDYSRPSLERALADLYQRYA